MKKLLLTLALIMCLTTVKAQGFGISLGPKVGYQTATLSLETADIQNSFANNWTAGIFVRMNIGKFIIHPELMYFKSEKVFNLEGTSLLNFNPRLTLNQQNLSLPIYLGYLLDGGLIKARFCAGPVMYFVVDQKQELSDDTFFSVDNIEPNNLTWGAALNIGFDVWRFTLDISYSLGLSYLFDDDEIDWHIGLAEGEINIDNTKQNMFMVTLGFKLLK